MSTSSSGNEPRRPVIGCSTAVVRDGKVLLAKRGTGVMLGLWSLPGGRLEWGERLADAALRELHEEVGVQARIIGLAGILEFLPGTDEDGHFIVHSYAARWVAGEPCVSAEAPEVMWADLETLRTLDTTADLDIVVARALDLAAADTDV